MKLVDKNPFSRDVMPLVTSHGFLEGKTDTPPSFTFSSPGVVAHETDFCFYYDFHC